MKILVTGAAGFIGSHLAERLAKEGHDVVGIDNFSDYYDVSLKEMNVRDVESKGIKIYRLDLVEDDLSRAVDGMEVVYHLAAQPGIAAHVPLEGFIKNNIIATHRLLEVVKDLSTLKFFVNVSTSSVYGKNADDNEDAAPKPISYYGVTKLAGEQLALSYQREYGMPACSVRMFSVYGPRERPDKLLPKVIQTLFDNIPLPLFEGSREHVRSFTYIDDIIDGFVLILHNLAQCEGEIFNFGFDQGIKMGDLLDIVEEISGKKLVTQTLPKRAGDQLRTQANIEKARKMLGYNPIITPQEGIKKMFEWHKEKFL